MSTLAARVDARLSQLPRTLALSWPGGRAGPACADVTLTAHRRRVLALLARGSVGGLADAYVRGQVDIDGALPDVIEVAAALAGDPVQRGQSARWRQSLRRLLRLFRWPPPRRIEQARFHYDLCDEFFALWLDPLRVYSCAWYDSPGCTLAQAQEAKLDLVCRKLKLASGQSFLDVGAGWGGLLMWAAEHYGVEATGITVSRNQHSHVNRLIDEKGLRGRVRMQLMDFRELPAQGQFDRVASIGMFEHVGRHRLDDYFGHLLRLVRPGGLVLNHGITAGGLYNTELGAGIGDFIERHIFPGGELVHVSEVARCMAHAGLELVDAENLRPHYARTLWAWSQALEARLEQARGLTSETTVRAYRLYLAFSAMAFERGWLGLYQLLATRPDGDPSTGVLRGAQSDYPFNRRYMLTRP